MAAKLLGWKIDIKSEEEKRQEVEEQMSALVGATATPLENVPGLGEGLVEKLSAAGVTTVEALADMTPEQLEAIEGIGPKTVEKISLAVNNYFSSLEAGEAASIAPEAEAAQETPAEGQEASAEEGAAPDSAGAQTTESGAEASAGGLGAAAEGGPAESGSREGATGQAGEPAGEH